MASKRRPDPRYSIWGAMMQRCHNPNNKHYKNYGGRGIEVCERWKNSANFLADIGPRPEGLTLERIDNDRGYAPDNCRWATRKEQSTNRRMTVWIVMDGEEMSLREACRRRGLEYRAVVKRIQQRKWPVELALYLPVGAGLGEGLKETELVLELWNENKRLRHALSVVMNSASAGTFPIKNWEWVAKAKDLTRVDGRYAVAKASLASSTCSARSTAPKS